MTEDVLSCAKVILVTTMIILSCKKRIDQGVNVWCHTPTLVPLPLVMKTALRVSLRMVISAPDSTNVTETPQPYPAVAGCF